MKIDYTADVKPVGFGLDDVALWSVRANAKPVRLLFSMEQVRALSPGGSISPLPAVMITRLNETLFRFEFPRNRPRPDETLFPRPVTVLIPEPVRQVAEPRRGGFTQWFQGMFTAMASVVNFG